MKTYFYSVSILLLLLVTSCDNNSDDNQDPDLTIPTLTDEIEVYNPELVHSNLILAIENGGTTSYLVNKGGNKVFTWNLDANLGNDFELLPDGRALGIFKTETPSFTFGGFGGIIKIVNPDGSIDWEYPYFSENYIAHHDVEMLPNGNVLFLVWEKIDLATAQQHGVNINTDIYPEKLIEVNPNNNEIVWEWRSWDHIIQDFDNMALNYGNLNDNPQLIDINYDLHANGDIMHANGIDYDSNKDIIYISVNYYNEIWVIDHSTTTAEAASNSGGNYNKGGDLIFRFGNPLTYDNTAGTPLFDRNHFPNLIEDGKPGEGNMLVYVNGVTTELSKVYELDIPETFNLTSDMNNEPGVVWSFENEDFFFGKLSGANRLSNGNTLICEGDYGYWEVTPNGEIAWKYNGTAGTYWRGYGYDFDNSALEGLGLNF